MFKLIVTSPDWQGERWGRWIALKDLPAQIKLLTNAGGDIVGIVEQA